MGSLWLADLVVWDEDDDKYLTGGSCTLDNNEATTIIFSEDLSTTGGWFSPTDGNCASSDDVLLTENGT